MVKFVDMQDMYIERNNNYFEKYDNLNTLQNQAGYSIVLLPICDRLHCNINLDV